MSKRCPQSLVSVTLLALAGCLAPRATAPSLIELNDSLDPLRNHFNDNRDRLRIVALLSPT